MLRKCKRENGYTKSFFRVYFLLVKINFVELVEL